MLDFDELQEFPNISSWATKSDFICDLMGTQNHNTLYDPWLQGSLCMGRLSGGNWTISTDVMKQAQYTAKTAMKNSKYAKWTYTRK